MRIVRFERTRKRDEDSRKAPFWLIGFTDMVTLLLAFFILLFATSIPKQGVWNTASESVRQRFGGDDVAQAPKGQAGHEDADKTWESEDRDPGLNLDYLYSIVRKYVASDPALKDVLVWYDRDAIVLTLGEDLTFAMGEADVSDKGGALLHTLAGYLATLPNTLEVVGYTDSAPIRGETHFNSNWHLSLVRAQNVAAVLEQRGYDAPILVRGKGVSEKSLPSTAPSKLLSGNDARRVDLRLYLLQP